MVQGFKLNELYITRMHTTHAHGRVFDARHKHADMNTHTSMRTHNIIFTLPQVPLAPRQRRSAQHPLFKKVMN